jgi:hypothetical protein
MSFKTIAIITAVVGCVLGFAYLFLGNLVVARWQIEPTDAVLVLGRRIGALYIGLGVMYFIARSAPVSPARTALSAGTAVALSILALLGVYEFTSGRVGPGIFVSAGIELLIALAYISVLVSERKTPIQG